MGINNTFMFNFVVSKDINIFCYSKYFNNFYYILKVIKNSVRYQLKVLNDIFVSDYLFYKKRFKICYNFSSNLFLKYYYLIFSIKLLEKAISINYIFKSALWMEREIFDMFGIIFINNWDLRKILTDYTFFGFPLRKDFPLSGYLELIFCEIKRITFETLVELMQEFRFFLNSSYIELWDHQ